MIDMQSYRTWLEMDVKDTTIETYMTIAKLFCEWCDLHGISVPDAAAMNQYLVYLKDSGESDNYLRCSYYAIRKLLTYLGTDRGLSSIRPPKVKSSKMRVTHYNDVQKMIEASDYTEDAVLVLMLYDCALRVGEVQRIRVRDLCLDDEHPHVLVWTLKQHRDRSEQDKVPLSKITVSVLRDYIQRAKLSPNDWLFKSRNRPGKAITEEAIRVRLKKLARKAGLDYVPNPHSLRHGRIEDILIWSVKNKKPVDPTEVQKFARHSSRRSTELYMNVLGLDIDMSGIPDIDEK